MKRYRIVDVHPLRYPVLRVTFEDGVSGEVDLSEAVATAPIFAPLRDPALFHQVELGMDGRTFGWNLGSPGQEIDLCADAARIKIEEAAVARLADDYRLHRPAAE